MGPIGRIGLMGPMKRETRLPKVGELAALDPLDNATLEGELVLVRHWLKDIVEVSVACQEQPERSFGVDGSMFEGVLYEPVVSVEDQRRLASDVRSHRRC